MDDHHAAPASGAKYAIDSRITHAIRDISARFEHRLFLSATPHNGHSNSFSALLELLDPQCFTRGVPVTKANLDSIMVRRLKEDIRHISGGFPRRVIVQEEIDNLPDDAPELKLTQLLEDYAAATELQLEAITDKTKRRKQIEFQLVISNLQQRLFSSIESFARTLSVHKRTIVKVNAKGSPHPLNLLTKGLDRNSYLAELEGAVDEHGEDEVEKAYAAEIASATSNVGLEIIEERRAILDEMSVISEAHRYSPDGRIERLLKWMQKNLCEGIGIPGKEKNSPEASWTESRVIIFTEYETTLRYIRDMLHAAIAGTELADQRIEIFYGATPTEKVISVGYSSELSEKFARDTKLVMESPWFKRAFPKTRISRGRHTAYDFNTTARGGRFSTSVEGTLTGRGGNFIIIDDPVKPTGVDSENTLKKVNQWYQNTLLSRLNNKETGCIIVIMQRLHEDDLSGYLLEEESGWHHLKIPAIAEENETWHFSNGSIINRNKGDVINEAQLSKKTLDQYKKNMGSVVFEGQYQQNPAPIEGAVIKTKWFKYYTQSELPTFKRVIISWDTASKIKETSAYSACCVFGVSEANEYYLLEVYRERLELPSLLKKVKEIHQRYKEQYSTTVDLLIEDAASGIQLIQLLKDEGVYCIPIKPSSDKLSRFKGAAVIVERGDVFVPKTQQSWWPEFENELLRFPNSKYKDQADSFAQVFSQYKKYTAGTW